MKMMKFFLLAAAAVAAISCAKENLPVENVTPAPEVELVPMTFTASYAEADDAETKVAYENGATVWQLGDKIMVISSTGTATDGLYSEGNYSGGTKGNSFTVSTTVTNVGQGAGGFGNPGGGMMPGQRGEMP